MPTENLRLQAYLALVREAGNYMFWATLEDNIPAGLVQVTMVALAAQEQGLTAAEIKAAIQIGEHRGTPHLPERLSQPDPALTPEYWQRVKEEAENFWLERYRIEE